MWSSSPSFGNLSLGSAHIALEGVCNIPTMSDIFCAGSAFLGPIYAVARSQVDFPMSVLTKIFSRFNEYQADRYSVAANRQYGRFLGTLPERGTLQVDFLICFSFLAVNGGNVCLCSSCEELRTSASVQFLG